ncbi:MAG: BMP family ABC transporter substrate-binding protein [Erysipelotrichaceae bacterium]|nr:BMP family ABC transporter substrate-binding protein [Erysipelotrichaceae bacterium]
MKKVLSLLLVLVLALSLVACDNKSGSTSGTTDGGDSDVTKIALLLPYIGDQSYFDVTYQGLSLLKEKYGDAVEVKLIEMGTDAAGWETANRQAAEAGYDIIISGNFEYEAAMLAVAKDYPDIKYLNFDYSDAEANSLPNVYAVSYACNELGYLTGVVAAIKSKSGVIGAVGGMDLNGIRQFIAGYFQGAMAVNPDIKVLSSFVGDFSDANKAKEISLNMIAQGADVIWGVAGGAGNGVFAAAAENPGVWAIGVDTDQYVTMAGQPELQATILTSGMKNCDKAILAGVTAIMEGTAPYGTQEFLTYKDGAVGLAENDYYKANMTEEELALVEEYTSKILTGEVSVVDELVTPGVYEELLAEVSD